LYLGTTATEVVTGVFPEADAMREYQVSIGSEACGNRNSAVPRLRVALLAGSLSRGGAEKQLFYIARALFELGVDVRVYSVTRGEPYEENLKAVGVPVHWFGRLGNPLLRLATLAILLRSHRPHVIQAGNAFTNLYAAILGRWFNAMSLGAQRSSWAYARQRNGIWTYPLMKAPSAVIANSERAVLEFTNRRILRPESVRVLPNAIDLGEYRAAETQTDTQSAAFPREPVAIFVARLIAVKRLDRFLRAFSLASKQVPGLKGIVVGEGPERKPMQQLAQEMGLSSRVSFLGERHDVGALLQNARFLVLSSDWEGTPNVILEAMAAALPVITTPVGDVAEIVVDGVTGSVVGFDDVQGMAARMVELARSPQLCRQLGVAGRNHVRRRHGLDGLGERLLAIYRDIARQQENDQVVRLLPERARTQLQG
jgi:glycosyltransferase involved in cell wall biosynthesis